MSRLYYTKEAGWDWNFALPVGNGKLGAMVFGNKEQEKLQLNEDSLWYGGPQERINQDAKENLEKVRELILSGKIPEAQDLLLHAFSGTPASQRPYQPFGELYIRYNDITGECLEYSRELNLETAVHTVKKTFNEITYKEEIFASALENVIVIHISTTDDVPVNIDVNANRMCFYDRGFHDKSNAYFTGKMVGDDYSYCGGITAFADRGEITLTGEYILCRNVVNLTILFTAATTFRENDPLAYVRKRLNEARYVEYEYLLNDHIQDYSALFGKCSFKLSYDANLDNLTTDERLERISEEVPDNGLVTTYFDYGRYLLISSSRLGSLPANLQGIWCKDIDPPWGCKFTININTQMNYWPAEMFGLGNCHLPLFEHMKLMQVDGHKTASEMYGCRGYVCHHNTDLWGNTAPQDTWIPGTYWIMSVPWLCTHIMQHYKYTNDVDFLRKMYPLIKDSVLFFHDFLLEIDGKTIICPSVSPENTYIMPNGTEGSVCAGSSMDNEILRDHFTQFIEAYEVVEDDDEEFLERTKTLLDGIPEIKIGKYGQIMEWLEDYDEKEPGHRHISQLYALHPSNQITVDSTPELAEAARKTIERRLSFGGGHTGWSRAWIMNMFARLWDKDKVYENLIALFKKSTLNNLFDNHPPFQIDGNFGSIAAMGEMLVQSNDNRVILLPALPDAFDCGRFNNLCVPGGAVYSLAWKDNKLTEFSVKADKCDYHTTVVYKNKKFKLDMAKGEVANFEIYEE